MQEEIQILEKKTKNQQDEQLDLKKQLLETQELLQAQKDKAREQREGFKKLVDVLKKEVHEKYQQ